MKYLNLLFLSLILGLFSGCAFEPATAEDEMNQNLKWAQSGELVPGSLARSVSMQASFEPGNYTIQFNVINPNTLQQVDEYIRTRATITWNINGVYVTRTIDVVNGTSISGTAEAVNVRVFDDSNIVSTDVVPYNVTVQATLGTRPSVQQPPYYTLNQIELGTSDNQSIPFDPAIGAISVSVAVAPFVAGQVILDNEILVFQSSESGAILKAYDPRTFQWVPLASGCKRIDIVTALSVATGATAQITFGIDG